MFVALQLATNAKYAIAYRSVSAMLVSLNNSRMCGYYQDKKTNAAVMAGTFMLNGKKYRLVSTGELSDATHFVNEIHRDDGTFAMPVDLQQIPELGILGPMSRNQNQNSGNDGIPGRMKRAISAVVDIVELLIYTDESIYQRYYYAQNLQ
ncbi:hypothetical protein CHS0354_032255 [Potamilus streckersoni]|uniref:Uncharacterized protein n=1 Tax=Potamilus streckersoni TaxID=2493646 RepID=A0AAE0RPT3_9BIVA|nr:hypothetical protein CHS0354_032255 [Potamilus streckersoni]